MKYLLIILSAGIISCSPGASNTSSSTNIPGDMESGVYEREIKSVRIYPNLNDPFQELFPAVAEIGKSNLLLEFDDLVDGRENYYARLIHCNADWTKSRLNALQYLDEYNEFPITDFEFSQSTRIPYVHYRFLLPEVKIPGNYILEVYRNTSDEMIMRQRIMYYQDLVDIKSDYYGAAFNINRLNQRINFKIDYSEYELIDPLERLKIVVRQNERWDKSVYNLRPTFIRQDLGELEYEYFDNENNFDAGNEFRAFDLRSLINAGANVQEVVLEDTVKAHLMIDKPRTYMAYSQDRDLNGQYVIINYDQGTDNYGGDYVNVIFTLKTSRKLLGDVYIHGGLTNWETQSNNKMTYSPRIKGYQGKLLLKQGWYNYQYLLKNDTLADNFIEGNHFQTENSYDILVYYRSLNLNADILIGYERWFVNPQF